MADYFDTRYLPPKMLTLTELNENYDIKLDFLRYHRVKTIIELGSERLNYKILNPDYSDICIPRQPILFKLSNLSKKGCRIFYRTLRARDLLSNSTEAAESKWQKEIKLTFSIKFWDDGWKLIKNPNIDNKSKWIQLQINRFILPTNYSVNKYNPNQDPGCSFCPQNSHLEKLQFLLWDCPKVNSFWTHVETFLRYFYPSYKLSKQKAIFGDTESDNEINTIIFWSKRYLWTQKFTSKKLDLDNYFKFIKQKVRDLLMVMQYRDRLLDFLKGWSKIAAFFEIEGFQS